MSSYKKTSAVKRKKKKKKPTITRVAAMCNDSPKELMAHEGNVCAGTREGPGRYYCTETSMITSQPL